MLKVDWSVNIGEHVFAITAGRCSKGLRPSQVDIVVVGTCSFDCKACVGINLSQRHRGGRAWVWDESKGVWGFCLVQWIRLRGFFFFGRLG